MKDYQLINILLLLIISSSKGYAENLEEIKKYHSQTSNEIMANEMLAHIVNALKEKEFQIENLPSMGYEIAKDM